MNLWQATRRFITRLGALAWLAVPSRRASASAVDQPPVEDVISLPEVLAAVFLLLAVVLAFLYILRSQKITATRDLQESEARYRTLFEAAADAIIIMKGECYLHFNRAALALFGGELEGLVNRPAFELSPPLQPDGQDSRSKALEKIQGALDGLPQFYEWRHTRLDGSCFDAEITLNRIEIGGQVFVQAIIRDISEREKTEESLRVSEERYRNLFDHSILGMFRSVPEGVFLEVNEEFARMYGYESPQEVLSSITSIGEQIFARPEDRMRMTRLLAECGEVRGFEAENKRKDGSTIWVRDNIRVVRDGEGKIIAYEGTEEDVTDRKKTEEALLKSEERYRNVFDNAVLGVFQSIPQGRFLAVNREYARIFGYDSPDQMIQEITDIPKQIYVNPADRARLVDTLARHGEVRGFECENRRKNGEPFWLRINARAVRTPQGEFHHLEGTVEDFSERRRMENALQESEERFRRLAENAPAMIYRMSLKNGQYEYVSPAAETIIGYPPQDFYSQPMLIQKVIHPDWRSYLEREWEKLLAGKMSPEYEYQILHKDGRTLWVHQRNMLVHDANGTPTHIEGIVSDVTQRKQSEEEIRSLNERLENRLVALTQPMADTSNLKFEDLFDVDEIQQIQDAFAQATGVASIITQVDGTPITRPSNFCRLCEKIIRGTEKGLKNCYHSDAELGRAHPGSPVIQPCLSGGLWDGGTSIMVGEHHVANWLIGQVLDESVDGERIVAYAREMGADEGEARQALMEVKHMPRQQFEEVCHALYMIAGQLSRLAVQNVQQARFIMERRQAEDEVRRLNAELEARVHERTLQLQTANRELESFAYSVSHDLRAPLRAVDGFTQMLAEEYSERLDGQALEYVNRVRGGVQRMGQLIDDLLRLSRFSRSEMQIVPVDLSAMVREIAREIAGEQPERQAEWVIAPDVHVRADAALVRVVLDNLLRNAWKFTVHSRNAKIEFGVEQREGGTVYFVSDNGAGFDMAYSGKLFGVFQRLHDGREFPGTGIGLATVQRIVHRHGGRVWAEGEVGKGAVFYFTLQEG